MPMKMLRHFKKIFCHFLLVVFAALVFLHAAPGALAVQFPRAVGQVNDFAGILAPAEEAELELRISQFEQATTNEIALAIVPAFQGMDPFSYSQSLFTSWKIGKAGKNNGILIVWGPREGLPFPERGHVFVNVGAGLEGALPDALAGSIVRNEMIPRFAEKKYFEGLLAGLNAIMKATQGAHLPEDSQAARRDSVSRMFFSFLLPLLMGILVVVPLMAVAAQAMRKRGLQRRWWVFGIVGLLGGFFFGFFNAQEHVWQVLLWAGGLGAGGFFLGYVLVKMKLPKEDSQDSSRSSRFGDFSGKGPSGGFGGFGGGSSRGGGAGGSY